MGQDYRECWFSAWPVIGPFFERCVETGEAAFLTDSRMFLDRNGYLEETFFTFSYSPIRDESGAIAGVFHPVTEATRLVLADRRLGVLRDLSGATAGADSVDDALARALGVLGGASLDLPFVAIYRVEPGRMHALLSGQAGCDDLSPDLPARIDLHDPDNPWRLLATTGADGLVELDDLQARTGGLRCGPYEEPPRSAVICPVSMSATGKPDIYLVAGVSARRALDDGYRGFYAMLRDALTTAVSKAHSHAEAVLRAEALAALDRAKTDFFSNVSHEFRTPLTLMLGPLEELLDGSRAKPLPDAERAQLDIVRRNGQRLLKLVNHLLKFSRTEAGRTQATFRSVDLSEFTAQLAGLFRSTVEHAGLEFDVECRQIDAPTYVDPAMWETIVLNLLSNAFKFTLEGGIRVRLKREDEHVRFTVSDTGGGIAPDQVARIFDRFHRVEGARGRSFEGTGIGLALVRDLVAVHGGGIDVESTPGLGTTFTVCIPLGHAHLSDQRVVEDETPLQRSGNAASFVAEASMWSHPGRRPPRHTRCPTVRCHRTTSRACVSCSQTTMPTCAPTLPACFRRNTTCWPWPTARRHWPACATSRRTSC